MLIATAFVLIALLLTIVVVLYVPIVSDQHNPPNLSMPAAKQLALGLTMYSVDYDDRMPPAERWEDLSLDYFALLGKERKLSFSDGLGKTDKRFAFFEALSCVSPELFSDESEVPMVFQSVLTERNAHGTLDQADWPLGGRCYVGFLDCHAKAMPKSWRFGAVTINIK